MFSNAQYREQNHVAARPRYSGCQQDDCQLCRNNPNKVCEGISCLDQQYWVRDDSKGGQLIKTRCGADIELQLVSRITNQPQFVPDARIKVRVSYWHLCVAGH